MHLALVLLSNAFVQNLPENIAKKLNFSSFSPSRYWWSITDGHRACDPKNAGFVLDS